MVHIAFPGISKTTSPRSLSLKKDSINSCKIRPDRKSRNHLFPCALLDFQSSSQCWWLIGISEILSNIYISTFSFKVELSYTVPLC